MLFAFFILLDFIIKFIVRFFLFALLLFFAFKAFSSDTVLCSSSPVISSDYSGYLSSDGKYHVTIKGCDYILAPDIPVLLSASKPSGSISLNPQLTWIPTGNISVIKDQPEPVDDSYLDTSLVRYCDQSGRCGGDGFPFDVDDWFDFQEADKKSHKTYSGYVSDTAKTISPGNDDDYSSSVVTRNASELFNDFNSCSRELVRIYDKSESSVIAHNSKSDECNRIYDKLSSKVPAGGFVPVSGDEYDFITSNYDGQLFSCKKDPVMKGFFLDRTSSISYGYSFEYAPKEFPSDVCNSSYRHLLSGSVPVNSHNTDKHVSDKHVSDIVSSGISNGDVVSAISSFHSDSNRNFSGLTDEIKASNKYLSQLTDEINKTNDALNDGKNSVDSSFSDYGSLSSSYINSFISSLGKYTPGIKGFSLPDGFFSGSGVCVPFYFSFNVSSLFFGYSFPVLLSTEKFCDFYDGYPRRLIEMFVYVLTGYSLIVLLKHSLE